MIIYRAEMYILNNYPHLIDLNKRYTNEFNPRNSSLSKSIPEMSRFFIIKGISEEDIHKSIKYNIWASTATGNQVLNSAYDSTAGNVYLFFTCNNSGRFLGVARMRSLVDQSKSFPLWTYDNFYKGLFSVEWVYIKDVPFSEFKAIKLQDSNKQVSYAKNNQEIDYEQGVKMLEIIDVYINSNTIIEHFEYYDNRQENYERSYNNNNGGYGNSGGYDSYN
jgi:hypothetical protein